jgi:hypothetical protein
MGSLLERGDPPGQFPSMRSGGRTAGGAKPRRARVCVERVRTRGHPGFSLRNAVPAIGRTSRRPARENAPKDTSLSPNGHEYFCPISRVTDEPLGLAYTLSPSPPHCPTPVPPAPWSRTPVEGTRASAPSRIVTCRSETRLHIMRARALVVPL